MLSVSLRSCTLAQECVRVGLRKHDSWYFPARFGGP